MAYSFCCAPLDAVRHCATATRCRDIPGVIGRRWPTYPDRLLRRICRCSFIAKSIRWLWTAGVSSVEKGRKTWPNARDNLTRKLPTTMSPAVLLRTSTPSQPRASGASAALDGAVGTIGVDVERPSSSLHDFAGDNHLFDTLQSRKIEHGLEQDALENRTQTARACLALDRFARHSPKR